MGMCFFGDPSGIRTPDPLLKRQLLCRLSYRVRIPTRARGEKWLGRLDSNQRVRESKSLALPLGYAPKWKKRGNRGYPGPLMSGVGDGTRTHNTWNHNPVLCQLNYTHQIQLKTVPLKALKNGTPEGIRTPGLLLRRQLLYPAELLAQIWSR